MQFISQQIVIQSLIHSVNQYVHTSVNKVTVGSYNKKRKKERRRRRFVKKKSPCFQMKNYAVNVFAVKTIKEND